MSKDQKKITNKLNFYKKNQLDVVFDNSVFIKHILCVIPLTVSNLTQKHVV